MTDIATIEPRGKRLLCSRYRRPEGEAVTDGGIILNPAWLRDNNRQLWRLERWSEDGAKLLRDSGNDPYPGMLLVTAPHQGTALQGSDDFFWIWADQVLIVLEEEKDDDSGE